jgi:hypothetical protein
VLAVLRARRRHCPSAGACVGRCCEQTTTKLNGWHACCGGGGRSQLLRSVRPRPRLRLRLRMRVLLRRRQALQYWVMLAVKMTMTLM